MRSKFYLSPLLFLFCVRICVTVCCGETPHFQAISNAKSNPEVSVNYDEKYIKADTSSVKCKLKITDLSLRNEGIETHLPQKENNWADTNIIEFWLYFESDTKDGGVIVIQPLWSKGHSVFLFNVKEGWNKISWVREDFNRKLRTLRISTFFEFYEEAEEITFYVSNFQRYSNVLARIKSLLSAVFHKLFSFFKMAVWGILILTLIVLFSKRLLRNKALMKKSVIEDYGATVVFCVLFLFSVTLVLRNSLRLEQFLNNVFSVSYDEAQEQILAGDTRVQNLDFYRIVKELHHSVSKDNRIHLVFFRGKKKFNAYYHQKLRYFFADYEQYKVSPFDDVSKLSSSHYKLFDYIALLYVRPEDAKGLGFLERQDLDLIFMKNNTHFLFKVEDPNAS